MKITIQFGLLLSTVITASCGSSRVIFVDYSNPKIEYWGRVDTSQTQGAALFWPGTSIRLNFEGQSVSATLKDSKGDNYYNVILDNDEPFIFRPDTLLRSHTLANGLSKGKHTIELFKRTEWDQGETTFRGITLEGSAKILPKSLPKKRKLEFYGNSITAGYAVEDTTGNDSPKGTFTNHYLSYAALTSRHYDAEFNTICKSGIGIMVSWFPMIMPEMYDRLNPNDPESKWDFSKYSPDIVIINLFQNDSWLVNNPEHEEFKKRFGSKVLGDVEIIASYMKFLVNIRSLYPDTRIICLLGNMDVTQEESKWPGYVVKAVNALNDQKIYTHFIPYKETPGHPSTREQEVMAESLIQFINSITGW